MSGVPPDGHPPTSYHAPDILRAVEKRYGRATPLAETNSAPADRFRLQDGTTFGIISSTTVPFCRSCDRSRLTADGLWYLCLYARAGTDLRQPLRAGASAVALRDIIEPVWRARNDRGAEVRLTAKESTIPHSSRHVAEGAPPRDAYPRGLIPETS